MYWKQHKEHEKICFRRKEKDSWNIEVIAFSYWEISSSIETSRPSIEG